MISTQSSFSKQSTIQLIRLKMTRVITAAILQPLADWLDFGLSSWCSTCKVIASENLTIFVVRPRPVKVVFRWRKHHALTWMMTLNYAVRERVT